MASGLSEPGGLRSKIENRPAKGRGRRKNPTAPTSTALVRQTNTLDARLLAHLEGLDDVALVDVVVRAKTDTTLEVRADLGGVVLEALERLNGEVVADDLAGAADAGSVRACRCRRGGRSRCASRSSPLPRSACRVAFSCRAEGRLF